MAKVTYKPLYIRKVNIKVNKKLEEICKKTSLEKWVVIDELLSHALNINTSRSVDVEKLVG